jgi:DNA-binding LacI/PurR family transcriptional regulator
MREGFFISLSIHRDRRDLVSAYPELLHSRGVDGILAIGTRLAENCPLPLSTVLVAGHTHLPEVTNVVLNHQRAAELAVGHLYQLDHRKIAFMQGHPFSSDSDTRWDATMQVAPELGLGASDELAVHLEKDSHSPAISYPSIPCLIDSRRPFYCCPLLQRCVSHGQHPCSA